MGSVRNRGSKDDPKWYVTWKDLDGKWKERLSKQGTKKSAEVYVAEIEARVRRGLVGIPEQTVEEQTARRLTVRDICNEYLEKFNRRSIRDIEQYRRTRRSVASRQILRFPIADMIASEVRKADVEQWLEDLESEYETNTINNALNLLSAVYNWMAETVPSLTNPCRRVERLAGESSEDHFTTEEIHRLLRKVEMPGADWSAGDRHLRPDEPTRLTYLAVALALHSGVRRGELMALRFEDMTLDGDVPRLHVRRSFKSPTTKTGKSRMIPLHSSLVPYFREWAKICPTRAEDGTGLVFPVLIKQHPGPDSPVHYRIAVLKDMLGIVDILHMAGCHIPVRPWHAMRHSCGTHLSAASGNAFVVSLILGHSVRTGNVSAPQTATYINSNVRHLSAEMEKMKLWPPPDAPVSDIDKARAERERRMGTAAPQ